MTMQTIMAIMTIQNAFIQWVNHIKFLGVLFGENDVRSKTRINLTEKIYQRASIGCILYRANILSYQSIAGSNLQKNYGNIARGSTCKTSLKIVYHHKKKAVRAIFLADRPAHVKALMCDINALNVYQINI